MVFSIVIDFGNFSVGVAKLLVHLGNPPPLLVDFIGLNLACLSDLLFTFSVTCKLYCFIKLYLNYRTIFFQMM